MFGLLPYSRRDSSLFRMMDDFERNFFNDSLDGSTQFRCDISEKDGNYLVEAELPGFDKEDIHVNLDGDRLTISATHKTETEDKDEDGKYIRRERHFGSYSRSFDVSEIDTENIKADYKNGMLSLTLPKAKAIAPVTRKIEISE